MYDLVSQVAQATAQTVLSDEQSKQLDSLVSCTGAERAQALKVIKECGWDVAKSADRFYRKRKSQEGLKKAKGAKSGAGKDEGEGQAGKTDREEHSDDGEEVEEEEEEEEEEDDTPWPPTEWEAGFICDALDRFGGWYEAKIMEVEESRVKVHFMGWNRKYDEWMPKDSEKMAKLYTKSVVEEEDEVDEELSEDEAAISQEEEQAEERKPHSSEEGEEEELAAAVEDTDKEPKQKKKRGRPVGSLGKKKTNKTVGKKEKVPKKKKVKRAPSAYNLFMRDELSKLKISHPHYNHKEAFKKKNKKNKKQEMVESGSEESRGAVWRMMRCTPRIMAL